MKHNPKLRLSQKCVFGNARHRQWKRVFRGYGPRSLGRFFRARSRQILKAFVAFRDGDFSARLPADWPGIDGRIAETFNQTIVREESITREVRRLSVTVGKEGRVKQRISLPGAVGDWAAMADSINILVDDLVRPTADVARTIGAVAKGDLSQSMELEVDGRALRGEFLRSAKFVNTMIEQLSVFTSEVTRVAREVGTEGKLGGQAQVQGRLGCMEGTHRIG